MNFFKILNLLAIVAISNVNASEKDNSVNTNMSNTLHLSNSSLTSLTGVNNEPFSCSLSSISAVNNDRNNSSLVVNTSGSLYLNTSPINISLNVEPSSSNTNSENKNNDSVIANTSDTLHLSNSSIDIAIDVEHEYFDCEESDIEENENSDVASTSEDEEYKVILGDLRR